MASDSEQAPAGSGQDVIEPVFGPPPPPPPPHPLPVVEDPQGGPHEPPGEGRGSPDPAAAAEAEAAAAAAAAAEADLKGKQVADGSPSASRSSSSSSDGIHEVLESGRELTVSWRNPLVERVMEAGAVAVEETEAEAAAAAAADRKGKKVLDDSPPPSHYSPSSSGSSSDEVGSGRGMRDDVFDVNKVFKRQRGLEWRPTTTGRNKNQRQLKVKARRPRRKAKNPIWMKVKYFMNATVLRRIRRHHSKSTSTLTQHHVYHLVINMVGMRRHYKLVTEQGEIINSNELLLRRAYRGFRPVLGDGECFYRSFIFSYLEQVLDRQDTHEEHRLLAVVKEVAREHACLGWTSKFSKRRKAFKKLIKKVMRWKRHIRWRRVPTTISMNYFSYRREKLLKYFRGYDKTKHIFAFLRLVAAIWICSHREEYEPRVSGLRRVGYTLKDWCFREVIRERIDVDHVQMAALVNALRVPLRVEYLFGGIGHQDLCTNQAPPVDVPRSMCCPRHRSHMLPPDHEVPRVSLLFSNNHYDIIYPHPSTGEEGCSQEARPRPGDGGGSSQEARPIPGDGGSQEACRIPAGDGGSQEACPIPEDGCVGGACPLPRRRACPIPAGDSGSQEACPIPEVDGCVGGACPLPRRRR